MSLQLSPPLESLRVEKLHYWSTCWKIIRRDGTIFRFTDHSSDLKVITDHTTLYQAGDPYETFKSATGVATSSRERNSQLEGSNLEARGMVTSDEIKEADLEAGLFDGATVIEYLFDWRCPWLGPISQTNYEIAETTYSSEIWTAQIEGIGRFLRQPAGDVYTKDGRIKKTPVSEVTSEVLTIITQRRMFRTQAGSLDTTAGAYDYGRIEWTTGANAGVLSVVRAMTNVGGGAPIQFELMLETPHDLSSGDDFKVSKIERADGFPFLPGTGELTGTVTPTRIE